MRRMLRWFDRQARQAIHFLVLSKGRRLLRATPSKCRYVGVARCFSCSLVFLCLINSYSFCAQPQQRAKARNEPAAQHFIHEAQKHANRKKERPACTMNEIDATDNTKHALPLHSMKSRRHLHERQSESRVRRYICWHLGMRGSGSQRVRG